MLCIGSGKGGVGKSSLTVNLAVALAAEGKKVGVLDADVWGYSVPRMLGLGAERPKVSAERKILPLEAHGLKVMSIGFFLDEDEAVVWRGPMLHKALTQFLEDVAWGELDHLLIDLPPGTGDVSMTLAGLLPQAKFIIVTTPQPTAQKVARRSAQMADKVNLEIAGVIENMSGFTTPGGERFQLFGEGGGQLLADEIDVPLLGKVPLTMPLREGADSGIPLARDRSGRRRRAGDPPGGARHHRALADRAAGAAGARRRPPRRSRWACAADGLSNVAEGECEERATRLAGEIESSPRIRVCPAHPTPSSTPCAPDEVAYLEEHGVKRQFPRGTALFHERQVSDRVMLLLAGRVKIASISEDGRESVLAFRGPGEVLGELSAIDGQPRSAGVTAIDPVEALVIPTAAFRAFLERSPKAALWILTRLIARLREADRKRAEFGASDTIGRVAARLVELAVDYGREQPGGGVRIDLPITQEELASWVGSSREGVNKALHTLRGLRWVETERRAITVLDMEALRTKRSRLAGTGAPSSLPGEVGGVALRELGPLVGQLVLGEARVHGARLDARIAVDALVGVDEEHLGLVVVGLVGRGVDAVDRAHLDAGVVLGADAGLCDDVGHGGSGSSVGCDSGAEPGILGSRPCSCSPAPRGGSDPRSSPS